MQKNESGIMVWLKQPSTWWKIGGVCVVIISMYYSLNYRVTSLEEFREQVDVITMQTDIAQIKTDLQRIKNDLQKNR